MFFSIYHKGYARTLHILSCLFDLPRIHILDTPDHPVHEILFQDLHYTPSLIVSFSFIHSFSSREPCFRAPLSPTKHQSFSCFPTHFRLRIPDFSLSAIYRCVSRSCYKVIKQNCYQRKLSGIPHLSKYSCLAFSRSSSVGAVLKVV